MADASSTNVLNIDSLQTLEQLQEAYDKLCVEETKIQNSINELCKQRIPEFDTSSLNTVKSDAYYLAKELRSTATLADGVSCKVRKIDEAGSRISACLRRVDDILDLKLCADGVKDALNEEDYELAASHIKRFLALDEAVLRKMDTSSALEASLKVLHEAHEKLKSVVKDRLNSAARNEDTATVERFFKLFPQLGEHDTGLATYCTHISNRLSKIMDADVKAALDNNVRYHVKFADSINILLEEAAGLVNTLEPLVNAYYGSDRLKDALLHVQAECDKHALTLLTSFENERKLNDLDDARQIDPVLAEISSLSYRAHLYARFIQRRAPDMPESKLSRRIHDLISSYVALEERWMTESVFKAKQMDGTFSLNTATVSSFVDDIFYVLEKCITRSLSTASVQAACAVINNAVTLLESNLLENLKIKLSSVDKQVLALYANNTQRAIENVKKLKSKFEDDRTVKESAKLTAVVCELNSSMSNFTSLQNEFCAKLHLNVVKAKIVAAIDFFSNVSHVLNEQDLDCYEVDDPWTFQAIATMDMAFKSLQEDLSTENFDTLINQSAHEFSIRLEKAILSRTFNRLGGMQLERDLRTLLTYITSLTSWTVRDKFARIQQMALVLSVENVDELKDYCGASSSFTWRLSPNDVRRILRLRKDVKARDIAALKLG
ncbi:DgyrCDS7507 [Dimorphilus gyrociliatus]|uniref:Conserved oligomeric Golgi complex subunit 4 n=1 Tax=Dimorphilus gyrociliatus TaxID=2664684 RepID=A0A7I8VRE6_9ANNE|nr:DgyrCDS7507 [Dimorphilus gyrociliatus]